ncbi:MAG: hypothetical protein CL521_01265 [Actinobacteria bacterium]|nr:hypothetical protein [Actinomycetota bacterium]
MHRTDINPVEMADALMEIKEKSSFTLQQIATAVGRNIDSIKQYSRISKLSHQEKTHHIQNQSSKNDILLYLAKSEKKPNNELQLVKQKNKITLKTISIHTNGKNKDSKESLEEKIKIANAFIKEAQTLLNTPK